MKLVLYLIHLFILKPNSVEFGTIKIVSSSGVSRTGTKSLEHVNTSTTDSNNISYTLGFKEGSEGNFGEISVTEGETYIFSGLVKKIW